MSDSGCFQYMPDPCMVLNADNTIKKVNAAFLKHISPKVNLGRYCICITAFRVSVKYVLFRSFVDNLIHPDDINNVTSILASCREVGIAVPETYDSPLLPACFRTLVLVNSVPSYISYDWSISVLPDCCSLLLSGRPVERTSTHASISSEFEDFFENAPIALHCMTDKMTKCATVLPS
jgi:hypothetical protein